MGLVPKLISPKGDCLLTETEYLIGRNHRCAICFPDDPKMSRVHATVFKENGRYYIKDGKIGQLIAGIIKPASRSANGTFVNGVQLDQASNWKIILKHGDEITLGETCLKFWFPLLTQDTDEGKETYSEKLN